MTLDLSESLILREEWNSDDQRSWTWGSQGTLKQMVFLIKKVLRRVISIMDNQTDYSSTYEECPGPSAIDKTDSMQGALSFSHSHKEEQRSPSNKWRSLQLEPVSSLSQMTCNVRNAKEKNWLWGCGVAEEGDTSSLLYTFGFGHHHW